jgi:predicted nucleic-acid-binding protein
LKVAVDTNVLLRIILADDPKQHRLAIRALEDASEVILSSVALCEAAWVLKRTYGLTRPEVADSIRAVLDITNASYETGPIQAGLAMLDDGGDFADGVIARQGRSNRADIFLSFDRKAVKRLCDLGERAAVPGADH